MKHVAVPLTITAAVLAAFFLAAAGQGVSPIASAIAAPPEQYDQIGIDDPAQPGNPAPGNPIYQADDDNLGCQVMLCLANPGGPSSIAECKPPIDKLRDRLLKGRSFPRCDMGGEEGGNYARQNGDCVGVWIAGQQQYAMNWRTGATGCAVGGGSGGGGGGRPGDDQPPQVIR